MISSTLKLRTSIAFVVLLIVFLPALVFCLEINPYIGIDNQLNKMKFKEGHGNNLFPKHFHQINMYSGLRFNNSSSVELGYVSTASKNRLSTLYTGDACLGTIVPKALSPAKFTSYIKITGYHLSSVNICSPEEWDHFRVLCGIGLSFLKAEAQRESIELGYPPIRGNIRTFRKQKAVPRIMLATEYKFNDDLGLRASFCFIQTSRMIIKAYPMAGAYTPVIKPKDSFIYSLGIFFEF